MAVLRREGAKLLLALTAPGGDARPEAPVPSLAEAAARSSQKSATRKLTRAELRPPDEEDDDPYDPTGTGKIAPGKG